jgi:hypothetical protein
MPHVGTILAGWGTKVLYLFDNDSGKKQGEKQLKKDWYIDDNDIKCVIEHKGSIEDLWSSAFFKKNICTDIDLDYDRPNSEYVKNNGIDKVLISKIFLAKVRQNGVKLDAETKSNIDKLVQVIQTHFGI